MAIDDLSPGQLGQLDLIRQRRRELTREAAREHRELLEIVNAAATRRSQKRHRFMLLAGGIVGVAAPLLLQRAATVEPAFIRIGSGLLLVNIIVGAVFDAIDEKRTTPILVRAGASLRRAKALTLAEDSKLISALVGDNASDLDVTIDAATRQADNADAELRKAGEKFADFSVLESVLFFGAFVLGVAFLLLAVGAAG